MIVKFPVLLPSALPPRHTRPRPAVILREAEFEVPHLSRSHLSEVATVKSTQFGAVETTTYLKWGDRVFRQRTADTERFLAELVDPTERFLTADHWNELMRGLSHLRDRRRVWPADIDRFVRTQFKSRQMVDLMSTPEVGTYPDDDLALYTHDWKRRFEHLLSNYIVVDGNLWCSTNLPHLAVSFRGWETELRLETDDVHLCGSRDADKGAGRFFFPLSELDEAVRFATELAAEHRRQPKFDPDLAILSIDPFSIPERTAAIELRRVAMAMAETLNEWLSREKGGDDLRRMANRLIDLAVEPLRDFDTDATEDLMSSMLSKCRSHHSQLGCYPAERILVRNFERQLAKWLDRPLRVSDIATSHGPS